MQKKRRLDGIDGRYHAVLRDVNDSSSDAPMADFKVKVGPSGPPASNMAHRFFTVRRYASPVYIFILFHQYMVAKTQTHTHVHKHINTYKQI